MALAKGDRATLTKEDVLSGQRYDINTPRNLTVDGRDAGVVRRVSVTAEEVSLDTVTVDLSVFPEAGYELTVNGVFLGTVRHAAVDARQDSRFTCSVDTVGSPVDLAEAVEYKRRADYYKMVADAAISMREFGAPRNADLDDIRGLCVQAWQDSDAVWPLIDRVLESRERPRKMRMYRWQTDSADRRPYRAALVFSDLEPDQVVGWLDSLSEHESCHDYSESGRYRFDGSEWKDYPDREDLSSFLLLSCGDGGIPWRGLPTSLLSWLSDRVTERRADPKDSIHSEETLRREMLAPAGELARRDEETDER